jgi:hypothetical protein
VRTMGRIDGASGMCTCCLFKQATRPAFLTARQTMKMDLASICTQSCIYTVWYSCSHLSIDGLTVLLSVATAL